MSQLNGIQGGYCGTKCQENTGLEADFAYDPLEQQASE